MGSIGTVGATPPPHSRHVLFRAMIAAALTASVVTTGELARSRRSRWAAFTRGVAWAGGTPLATALALQPLAVTGP